MSDAFEAVPFSNWSAGSAYAWRDPDAVSFLVLHPRDLHREAIIDEKCDVCSENGDFKICTATCAHVNVLLEAALKVKYLQI